MKDAVVLKLTTNCQKWDNEMQQRNLVFLRLPCVVYSNNERPSWLLVTMTITSRWCRADAQNRGSLIFLFYCYCCSFYFLTKIRATFYVNIIQDTNESLAILCFPHFAGRVAANAGGCFFHPLCILWICLFFKLCYQFGIDSLQFIFRPVKN